MSLLTACAEEVSRPAEPSLDWVDKQVGAHQLRFLVPKGWQHLDQGAIQTFRKAGALLELKDLGIYSRPGVMRHIEHAQDLYLKGEPLAAQEHLKRLPYLQAAFLKTDDWLKVAAHWRILTQRQAQGETQRIVQAYDEVLNLLSYQPDTDFESVTEKLLDIEDRNSQRDVSNQEILSIDGRKAVLVETWDELSHSMKMQHLFVLNKDSILGMNVRLGRYEDVAQAFEQITASLRFPMDNEY